MSLEKIADAPVPCVHPEHAPPSNIVLAPGTYRHTCPSCGRQRVFTVPQIVCGAAA